MVATVRSDSLRARFALTRALASSTLRRECRQRTAMTSASNELRRSAGCVVFALRCTTVSQ